MNKYYSKYKNKDNFSNNRYYNYKTNHYHKKNYYNNNYYCYNKNNYNNYTYDEETSYEKETTISTETYSTKEDSFSKSSKSTSRKHSYCEYNNDNFDNTIPLIISNDIEKTKVENIPKINLSEKELETAFFKPKNFKVTLPTKDENEVKKENKYENENINILEISVKISKDKIILFSLKKYDDLFQVSKDACIKNELSEDYADLFAYKIIKALNSIYGIYNLKLKEDEIKTLKELEERFKDNYDNDLN